MKSCFLYAISDVATAEAGLNRLLPIQRQPWILVAEPGDTIAYFNVYDVNVDFEGPDDPAGPGPMVQADISGRHYNEDEAVLAVLRQLQQTAGGLVMNDNGELV